MAQITDCYNVLLIVARKGWNSPMHDSVAQFLYKQKIRLQEATNHCPSTKGWIVLQPKGILVLALAHISPLKSKCQWIPKKFVV